MESRHLIGILSKEEPSAVSERSRGSVRSSLEATWKVDVRLWQLG